MHTKCVPNVLQNLQSKLCVYEDKLAVLQALRKRLTRVSDDKTQQAFLASLADLRNQLQVCEIQKHLRSCIQFI